SGGGSGSGSGSRNGGGSGLGGTITGTAFQVPAGTTTTVTSDLVVRTTGPITIQGTLLVAPGVDVALLAGGAPDGQGSRDPPPGGRRNSGTGRSPTCFSRGIRSASWDRWSPRATSSSASGARAGRLRRPWTSRAARTRGPPSGRAPAGPPVKPGRQARAGGT